MKPSITIALCLFILSIVCTPSFAGDITFKCKVIKVYDLKNDGSIKPSNFEKQFKGSKFTVSGSTGKIEGEVLTTLMANTTKVLNKGNDSYSFKSIAEFDSVNKPLSNGKEDTTNTVSVQLLEIQVFEKGVQKPFIAMSMGGAGIVTGTCMSKIVNK